MSRSAATILIVDDDEPVRKVIARLLQVLGYNVIVAESGKTAIQLFKKESRQIHLAMVDLFMPAFMARDTNSPARTLSRTNEVLMSEATNVRFITLFYSVVDPRSGKMVSARAGHEPTLWWRSHAREIVDLQPSGHALGILPNITLSEEISKVDLNDVVLFYTDGVTEALNAENEEFSQERLKELIRAHHGLTAEALAERIQQEVDSFIGARTPSDDFTLVVLKRVKTSP